MNIFSLILLLSIIVFCVYILSVLVVQYYKKVDTCTARTIISTFVKNCFTTTVQERFNIYIGIDQNGTPNAGEIENVFSDLKHIFKNFYLYNWGQNRRYSIFYQFRVSLPVVQLSDEDLYDYCQATCDAIVHRYIHQCNPTFAHMDNLVAVNLVNSVLTVTIAENSEGVRQNAMHTAHMHQFYKQMSMPSPSGDIPENWY